MYTVSKGPSKIVAKTRRGLSQNYEIFDTIKESGKLSSDANSSVNNTVPRPVFQTTKKSILNNNKMEEEVITPQHEEIIRYINDSWNLMVAHNPYDTNCTSKAKEASVDPNNNFASISTTTISSSASSFACTLPASSQRTSSVYCVEPPSPVLSDFKPFDLESWWGRRLFNNITKSL